MSSEKTESKNVVTEGADRRKLLRNTALVAGAAATLGAVAKSNAATVCEDPDKIEKKTFSVKFDARKQVEIHHVHDVLKQVFDAANCTTCGLNGVDIRLELDTLHDIRTEIPVSVSSGY